MTHEVYIVGEINEESFRAFCEDLDGPSRDIEIVLNSAGGSSIDGLAFYSRIRQISAKTSVTVYGACWSAATIILAACEHRRMTREAWVMVHEDSDSLKHVSTSQFEKKAKELRRFEDQWNEILAKRTKVSAQKWKEINASETYLTAKECLELGLIDEIV